MNITSGIKKRLVYTGIGFFLLGMIACEKKDVPFGEEFVQSHTNIVLIDTVTPSLSTYKLDSFATSGSGTAVIGSYQDVAFGKISSRSFLQLGIPTATTIPLDAIFDSLTFVLTPTKQYYGDTTVSQTIKVHELTETLAFATGKSQLFNTSSFSYNPTPLGTKQFTPQPSKIDSIIIRLSDVKGNELFTKLKDKSTDITDLASFLRYFKGIVLESTGASGAILNYAATGSALSMRLYYRERGVTFTQKYVQFPITNTNLQFNQLTIDRSGTPLAGLPNHFPEVPAASLGHAAYLQYASGLFGKITFPSLGNLLNIDSYGKVLRAELIIKPLAGTFNILNKDPYRLPSQLYLGVTDKFNNPGSLITDASGATETGNLFIDGLYGENTNYSYDVTAFIQQQLHVNEAIRKGLVIYSPSSFLFNRLIVGDETTGKSRIQLKISYLVVD